MKSLLELEKAKKHVHWGIHERTKGKLNMKTKQSIKILSGV